LLKFVAGGSIIQEKGYKFIDLWWSGIIII
jgi:hypothetical protein